jgi:hypothetical protein
MKFCIAIVENAHKDDVSRKAAIITDSSKFNYYSGKGFNRKTILYA